MFWSHKYHCVDEIPDKEFEKHTVLYGKVEEITDQDGGSVMRIRHVPGYSSTHAIPWMPIEGDFEQETLLVVLYGIDMYDCLSSQELREEAQEMIGNLVYHQMVELTLMQKRLPATSSPPSPSFLPVDAEAPSNIASLNCLTSTAALCQVKTVVCQNTALKRCPVQPKDLSVLLCHAGFAKPTSEYSIDQESLRKALEDATLRAKRDHLGVWANYKATSLRHDHPNSCDDDAHHQPPSN